MNRRSFLKFAGLGVGTAAAASLTPAMLEGFVVDPERLLWEPGAKTILLPPVRTFSLYTPDDLRAMERAMGVLRFFDPRGILRLETFDASRPHAVDALQALSDSEVRLAIETGYDLLPGYRAAYIRLGAYDGKSPVGRVETGRGYICVGAIRHPRDYFVADELFITSGGAGYVVAGTPRHAPRGFVASFTNAEIDARDLHRHGPSIVDAHGDRWTDVVTTEATDQGTVTISRLERKGY